MLEFVRSIVLRAPNSHYSSVVLIDFIANNLDVGILKHGQSEVKKYRTIELTNSLTNKYTELIDWLIDLLFFNYIVDILYM